MQQIRIEFRSNNRRTMTSNDEILRKILDNSKIKEKYGLSDKDIQEMRANAPYTETIQNVLSTIINEYFNNRNERQIYSRVKKIHNI